jgi:hypothetical protein
MSRFESVCFKASVAFSAACLLAIAGAMIGAAAI